MSRPRRRSSCLLESPPPGPSRRPAPAREPSGPAVRRCSPGGGHDDAGQLHPHRRRPGWSPVPPGSRRDIRVRTPIGGARTAPWTADCAGGAWGSDGSQPGSPSRPDRTRGWTTRVAPVFAAPIASVAEGSGAARDSRADRGSPRSRDSPPSRVRVAGTVPCTSAVGVRAYPARSSARRGGCGRPAARCAGTRPAGEAAQCAAQSVAAGSRRRRTRGFRVEQGARSRRGVRRKHVRVGLGEAVNAQNARTSPAPASRCRARVRNAVWAVRKSAACLAPHSPGLSLPGGPMAAPDTLVSAHLPPPPLSAGTGLPLGPESIQSREDVRSRPSFAGQRGRALSLRARLPGAIARSIPSLPRSPPSSSSPSPLRRRRGRTSVRRSAALPMPPASAGAAPDRSGPAGGAPA